MGSSALDQAARAQGFRDFATYQAYQAHQRQLIGSQAPAAVPAQPHPAQPQQPPQNWLQRLISNYTPLGGAMARVRKALP